MFAAAADDDDGRGGGGGDGLGACCCLNDDGGGRDGDGGRTVCLLRAVALAGLVWPGNLLVGISGSIVATMVLLLLSLGRLRKANTSPLLLLLLLSILLLLPQFLSWGRAPELNIVVPGRFLGEKGASINLLCESSPLMSPALRLSSSLSRSSSGMMVLMTLCRWRM